MQVNISEQQYFAIGATCCMNINSWAAFTQPQGILFFPL